MKISNKPNSLQACLYGLLCSSIVLAHCGHAIAVESQTEQNPELPVRQVKIHGEGKQAADCNFNQITIFYDGKSTILEPTSLITLPAEGNVEASARRIVQQGQPVLPVAKLIADHPEASNIAFESCNKKNNLEVSREEIEKNSKTYILSFNRTGRPRLARFEKEGKRGQYNTIVKNIIAIRLD